MRWKQFFTPVKSYDSDEVRNLQKFSPEELQFLDVRQPGEYAASHIAGARLIPLPQLAASLDQLDRDRPVVVY